MARLSQRDLIFQYFQARPNQDIPTAEVVDWSTNEWERLTGEILRDPDRQVRSLAQQGLLIKVRNGLYRYSPVRVGRTVLTDGGFTQAQKAEILRAGKYRCAICGATRDSGAVLHVDHIKPLVKGGRSEITNGQVLCSEHNMKKGAYNQTETGKRFFLNLLKLARSNRDVTLVAFLEDVLELYDYHGVNSHIDWDNLG